MAWLLATPSHFFRPLWQALRYWCGDSAYDRYLRAVRRRRGPAPLSRKAFYLEQVQRRYSRPSRCC